MNIRKPIDTSEMFAALDALMTKNLPQMELYCEIGKVVNNRTEKGAAVAASEYLQSAYPDVPGFSPRNLRRMRAFYRTYENSPAILREAMRLGWTQNVVILESELSLDEKAWYIQAAIHSQWSKQELARKIEDRAHEANALDTREDLCYTGTDETVGVESQTDSGESSSHSASAIVDQAADHLSQKSRKARAASGTNIDAERMLAPPICRAKRRKETACRRKDGIFRRWRDRRAASTKGLHMTAISLGAGFWQPYRC